MVLVLQDRSIKTIEFLCQCRNHGKSLSLSWYVLSLMMSFKNCSEISPRFCFFDISTIWEQVWPFRIENLSYCCSIQDTNFFNNLSISDFEEQFSDFFTFPSGFDVLGRTNSLTVFSVPRFSSTCFCSRQILVHLDYKHLFKIRNHDTHIFLSLSVCINISITLLQLVLF